MATNCAMMYFDDANKSVGYIMGSNGLSAISVAGDPAQEICQFSCDNSFQGKNLVGFFRGTYSRTYSAAQIKTEKANLAAVFEGISPGESYPCPQLLSENSTFDFFICKRGLDYLDLLLVKRPADEIASTASLMHRLTPSMYHSLQESVVFASPGTKEYIGLAMDSVRPTKEMAFAAAKSVLSLDINGPLPDRKGIIYAVSFEGIEQLEVPSVRDADLPGLWHSARNVN